MNLSLKLQMRQSQSLVMTPQLLQSIRLLQFGAMELDAFVRQAVEQNPLLEVVAPGRKAKDTSAATHSEPGPADSAPARSGPLQGAGAERGAGGVEDLADERISLLAHALREVADIFPGELERRIGEACAMHLDDTGYLRASAADLAADLGIGQDRVSACLLTLRMRAEPAGLFATDLADCLGLQLARHGRLDPVIAIVLDNLPLLARRDFQTLRRLTGEDEDGLMDILGEIRRLDPKPGLAFARQPADIVAPDVFVTANSRGGWRVRLNTRSLPRLIIQNDYTSAVDTMAEGDRAYLAQCQQSASWLVKSLDQRARTILKVTSEIFRRQDAFLTRGVDGLKPMTLACVADAVGLHESTVSRVTANKYVQTPRGTFELKYFFTNAISASDGGDAHSAESVKLRIRRLLDEETAGAVLSDDDIAERLKEQGIDLARRTVAKYREALGIASSIQRRRELNAARLAS